ncbi:toprim domain-containing protein, partial [Streptococcus gallolyticus]|uniref:toprim domain-containing protein n=1 Tax=Streptococcus gallolyticus TaxID=315405 RepID=UPI0018C86331
MPEKETRAKSRKERREVARSRAILDVANELHMDLFRSGRDYRWKEHDSLVISPDKNLWKWFSRNLGGDVISLVETIKETDFNQSVNFLNDGEFKTFQRVERSEEPFNYYLHPYEQPFNEARTYLREERGLSDDTIDFFLEKGVLVQANAKLNDSIEPVVVFKTLSPSGEVVGANLQGIEENFEKWPERGYAKIIARNSDGMNGLHVDIGQPKRLVFAESPIDLMSYYELHKDNLQDVRLVSMDGLKESTIGRHLAELQAERSGRELRWSKEELANGLTTAVDNNYFTEGKHADVITLAVDNDEAGRNFITSLQDKGVSLTVDIPDLPEGQEKADWNSYLQQKKQSTPETEAITSERLPLSNIQDHLSTEADLVSTIASDGSMLYTNTVNFDQAYSLNLEVHSPEEVDNLSDVKAPWSLEVTKDNQSLGFLAYGEDWGNDFNIEDELVNLDSWVTRNQVENHLYSQEEVNSFLKPLTAEKEAVGELKS